MPAWPVLSTTAQRDGPGQEIDDDRDPGCPGPGSAGLGGGPVPVAAGCRRRPVGAVPAADVVRAVHDRARRSRRARDGGEHRSGHRASGRRREVDRGVGPRCAVPRHRHPRAAGRRGVSVGAAPDRHAEGVRDARQRGEPPPGRQRGEGRRPPGGRLHRGGDGGRGGRGNLAGAGGGDGGRRVRPVDRVECRRRRSAGAPACYRRHDDHEDRCDPSGCHVPPSGRGPEARSVRLGASRSRNTMPVRGFGKK